jgi:hypothetical protein
MLSTLRYLAFAVIAIGGPGIALQRLAGVGVDPALVIPLGVAVTALTYALSLELGFAWVYPVSILLIVGGALLRRTPLAVVPGPRLRGALVPIAVTVGVLAATQYGGNRVSSSGEFLIDNLVPYDTAFHVGLARELTLGYPPQLPGVSGFGITYHLGPDMVRAAALRWAGVDPFDSINRFDVTLGAVALILVLRSVTQMIGGGPFAVGLAGFIPLLADFSFVFAANPQAHWWVDLLRGNLLVSLALSNPVIPALALSLGVLIALERDRGETPGWLWLATIQSLVVPHFKVFVAAHLLLGLGVAAVVAVAGGRRPWRAAGAFFPCALFTALMVAGGSRSVAVVVAPFDLVRITRESLALVPLSGLAFAGWAVLWLAASLGLRLFGLREAWRGVWRGGWAAPALAAMALAAWPLGLLFRVAAPQMLEGQKTVNDAAYLVEQGGPLLWVFTVIALGAWAGPRFDRRAIVIAAGVLLALPSSIQFAWKKATLPYDPVPAPMVRAMNALADASQPGDVVLQRPGARYPPLPVVLIGRRVPYERFTPWLTQFASAESLEQRHEMVFRFFRTADRGEATTIAHVLNARFVALYGADRLRFDTTGVLEPIYEDGDVRVLRVIAANR